MNMTPERLRELVNYCELHDLTYEETNEIAAFLRDCAKCEPVYQFMNLDGLWIDCINKDQFEILTAYQKKRILYTAPQISHDESNESPVGYIYRQGRHLITGSFSKCLAPMMNKEVVPLYLHPQSVKVPDFLIDVSREASYSIGWNACRAEVLRLNEVK